MRSSSVARLLTSRLGRLAVLGAVLLLLVGLPLPVHAASSTYPALTGAITGPSRVGRGLQVQYIVNGSGGPAEAANGTQVGNITYNATLSGANVSTASITPPTGVLINGEVTLRFTAPNLTETVRITVRLISSYAGANTSTNLSKLVQIVQPYVLSGTVVTGATGVTGFNLTVLLDGLPVGRVSIPSIAPNSSYRFTFDYVPTSLGAGWHTIAVSLAEEHGLVAFQGGVEQLSLRFYIAEAPPNYALDVGVGIAAFAAAVFIWGSVVGARRRGRRAR